jgi:hypothetical protein
MRVHIVSCFFHFCKISFFISFFAIVEPPHLFFLFDSLKGSISRSHPPREGSDLRSHFPNVEGCCGEILPPSRDVRSGGPRKDGCPLESAVPTRSVPRDGEEEEGVEGST